MPQFRYPDDDPEALETALRPLAYGGADEWTLDYKLDQASMWLDKFGTDAADWTGDVAVFVKGRVTKLSEWFKPIQQKLVQDLAPPLLDYIKTVRESHTEIRKLNKEYADMDEADREAALPGLEKRHKIAFDMVGTKGKEVGGKLKQLAERYSPNAAAARHINQEAFGVTLPKLPPLVLPKTVFPDVKAVPILPTHLVRDPKEREKANVRTVQAALRDRGWNIDVDGRFGPNTESVIKQFQRNRGLPVTGKVGWTTWQALFTKKVVP